MSTTTTSTTTYNIATYRYQQDKPGIIRPHVPKDEWRIYPNTVPSALRLILEITRTASGAYASVVMKIVDTDTTRPGGPSTLDKLDFLDFSSPEVAKMPSSLKAVLGGKQVGLRYLHPLNAEATAQYHKRFQLTFASAEDASALVASIREVCPTSESPQVCTVKTVQRAKAMGKPSAITQEPQSQTQDDTVIRKGFNPTVSQTSWPRAAIPQEDAIMRGSQPSATPSHQTPHPTISPLDTGMDIDSPVVSTRPSHPLASSPMPHTSNPPSSQRHLMRQYSTTSEAPPYSFTTPPANTVSTALPSSGRLVNFSQAPLGPRQTPTPESSAGVIPPFSQIQPFTMQFTEPDIQDLSSDELESMIAQVVHEPGFAELMEKFDKMYALKGFIRH